MHKSLPVTPSDKAMSRRHLKGRIKLLKASIKMNAEHEADHKKGRMKAKHELGEAMRRKAVVERM